MPRIGGAGQGFMRLRILRTAGSLRCEAGIDSLMRADEVPAGPNDPLLAMKDGIRRRMDTPRDQFIPWDGEAMAARVKAKLGRT